MSKRNIFIFTPFFLPGRSYGGPITSVYSLFNHLSTEFQSITIFTADTDFSSTQRYSSNDLKAVDVDIRDSILYLSKVNQILAPLIALLGSKPNSVFYFNSFFSFRSTFCALIFSRLIVRLGHAIYISPRSELLPLRLGRKSFKKSFYLRFISPFIARKVHFVASNIEESNAIKSLFPSHKISVIQNIPSTFFLDKFDTSASITSRLSRYHVFFCSRIHEEKNLHVLVACLGMASEYLDQHIDIDVIGPIASLEYWQRCCALSKDYKYIKINYHGVMSPPQISSLYSSGSIFALLSETENYCHSVVEASLSGLVVVSSMGIPWFKSSSLSRINNLNPCDYDSIVQSFVWLFTASSADLDRLQKLQSEEVLNSIMLARKSWTLLFNH